VNDLQRVGVGYVEYCSSQLHRSFKLDVGGREISYIRHFCCISHCRFFFPTLPTYAVRFSEVLSFGRHENSVVVGVTRE
jgi:hypothetical protein